jgi:hypothetical protein
MKIFARNAILSVFTWPAGLINQVKSGRNPSSLLVNNEKLERNPVNNAQLGHNPVIISE